MTNAKIFLIKFILWAVGLCVSALPLIVSVQTFPGDWNGAFNLASYAGKEAKVLYISIALSAVCIAEMIELLVTANVRGEQAPVFVSFVILAVSIVLVIICALYYGQAITARELDTAFPAEALKAVFIITSTVAGLALASKAVIWSRETFFAVPRERRQA